ncbi:MAG: PQQ-binding-like beta-propeller repeat protein [Phycisphaerae bacterium]|nr:PQQ-binding-like beta-propeller repeat protein [Phycisphaerae bacterium]
MQRPNGEPVFIGIAGTVLALDRSTGEEIWRTPLKGSDFVNLALDGNQLLASVRGEVFCLDPATGEILWHNGLKGLGWGLVSFTSRSMSSSTGCVMAAEGSRRQQRAATAT